MGGVKKSAKHRSSKSKSRSKQHIKNQNSIYRKFLKHYLSGGNQAMNASILKPETSLQTTKALAKIAKKEAKLLKEAKRAEKLALKQAKEALRAEKAAKKAEKEAAKKVALEKKEAKAALKAEKEAAKKAKLEKKEAKAALKAQKEAEKADKLAKKAAEEAAKKAELEKKEAEKAAKEAAKKAALEKKAAKKAAKEALLAAKLAKIAEKAAKKAAKEAKLAAKEAKKPKPVPNPKSEEFQDYICYLMGLTPKEIDKKYPFLKVPHKIKGETIKEHLEKISAPDERIDACSSSAKKLEIQPHQSIIYAMANLRAKNLIQTPGLLAIHSTGAGKTLAALITFLAFWHSKNPATNQLWSLFFLSTKGNQDSNSLHKLAELGIKFFPDFVDNTGATPVKIFDVEHAPETSQRVKQLLEKDVQPSLDPVCQEYSVKFLRERIFKGMESIYKPEFFQEIKDRSRDNLLTFAKFANDVEMNVFKTNHGSIENALFVIDEVQFLMAPPENEKHLTKQYNSLKSFLLNHRNPANTWILAMSATPGETREQVSGILNIVAGNDGLFKPADFDDPNKIVDKARGIVSYANLTGDFSHFAKLSISSVCSALDSRSAYYNRYMKILETFMNDKERYLKESKYNPDSKHKFYAKLREAGNFIVKSMNAKKSRKMDDDDDEFEDEFADFDESNEDISSEIIVPTKDGRGEYKMFISPKLIQAIANIKNLPGKHYVYSSSTTTTLLIAYLLEKYCDITPLPIKCEPIPTEASESSQKNNAHNKNAAPEKKHFAPPKMACSVSSSEKSNESQQKHFILLDNIQTKKEYLKNYSFPNAPTTRIDTGKSWTNQLENYNGNRVKVILATKENFKGIDMNHIRYLHLIDPLVDFQDFIQFMGRGPRFCSHRKFPINKRNVDLFVYRNVFGKNCPTSDKTAAQLADCFVFENSLNRYQNNWAVVEKCLQFASVDYKVFKDNIHKNNDNIIKQILHLGCSTVLSQNEIIKLMGHQFESEQRAAREAEMAIEKQKANAIRAEQAKRINTSRMSRAERAALRQAVRNGSLMR